MRKSLIAAAAFALTSTTALAADFAEPAAPEFSWTGFYVGAWAAYNDVERDLTLSAGASELEFNDGFDGFSGGALLGFNYQFDSIVVGIEGDIGFASIKDDEIIAATGGTFLALEDEIDMTYGVRARLGYAVDHTLLFITGGVAWADYQSTLNVFNATASVSTDLIDETLFGWQFGGGVEQAVTDNITVRLEYLYTDYEDADDSIGGTDIEADLNSHSIRLGVNFLFNAF